jgi:hypothetical protein
LSVQLEINDWTHANGVFFVSAETRGLFGCVHEAYIYDLYLMHGL